MVRFCIGKGRYKGALLCCKGRCKIMMRFHVQGKEGLKGRHWYMEADMKQTHTLRPDKTGKALLTVLRHLGRLHEVGPTSSPDLDRFNLLPVMRTNLNALGVMFDTVRCTCFFPKLPLRCAT